MVEREKVVLGKKYYKGIEKLSRVEKRIEKKLRKIARSKKAN